MYTGIEQINKCKADGESQLSHSWKWKAIGWNELCGTGLEVET